MSAHGHAKYLLDLDNNERPNNAGTRFPRRSGMDGYDMLWSQSRAVGSEQQHRLYSQILVFSTNLFFFF